MKGRLEGWVKVRVAGQTDWKRVWAIISARAGAPGSIPGTNGNTEGDGEKRSVSPTATLQKRNRMSSFFGSSSSASSNRPSSPTQQQQPPSPQSGPATIALYASTKPKDRKTPLLTITDLTQAFSVYPDRVELINLSTLIKVEGKVGSGSGEFASVGDNNSGGKGREGWMFLMPEVDGGALPPMEMLKWIVGEYFSQLTQMVC